MDEGFMHQVKERIVAATSASTSIRTSANPGRHSVHTLEEWMASYFPDAKYRCAECKCPAVEGAERICIACGSLLPPTAAAKQDPFIFDKSLTKKHFCGSVHLEYRDDYDRAPSSIEQTVQATLSGIKESSDVHGMLRQSHPVAESGVIVDEKSSRNGGGNVYTLGDLKSNNQVGMIFEKDTNEENYAWKSTEVHNGEPMAVIEILSPGRRGSSATRGYLEGASSLPEASTPHTLEVDAAPMLAGVPTPTMEPHAQVEKDDTSWQHLEKDFDAFFQGTASSSLPSTSTDIGIDSSFPGLLEGFDSRNAETDLDTFFSVAPESGGQVEEKSAGFAEQSRVQNLEDLDGFFQVSSNSVDQSDRQNLKTGDMIAVDGFGSSGLDLGFNTLFRTPSSAGQSFHQSVENSELRGDNLEVNLDQYFQAVAITSNSGDPGNPDSYFNFGAQNEEAISVRFVSVLPKPANFPAGQHTYHSSPNSNSGQDFDGQDVNVDVDFKDFFQESLNSELQNVKTGSLTPVAEYNGQDVQTEFDGAFLPTLTASEQEVDNGSARPSALEDPNRHTRDLDFTGFFAAGSEPANQPKSEELFEAGNAAEESEGKRLQRMDLHREISESGAQSGVLHEETVGFSVTKPSEGQSLEVEFDDFLQASSKSRSDSGNVGLTEISSTPRQNSGGLSEETDFEDFRQADSKLFNQPHGHGGDSASLESAPAPHEQIFDADFDNFFQVPSSSWDTSQKETEKADGTELSFPATAAVAVEKHQENGNAELHDFFSTRKSSQHSGDMEQRFADMTLFEQSSSRSANIDFLDGFVQTTPKSLDTVHLSQTPATKANLFNGIHSEDISLAHTSSMDFDDFVQAPIVPGESLRKVETIGFDNLFAVGNQSMENSMEMKGTLDGLQDANHSVGSLPGGENRAESFLFKPPRYVASESPGQNIRTEFDQMFRASQARDTSFPDNFESLFQTAVRPASNVHDPTEISDFDFFQNSAKSYEVPKHSGTAADNLYTVGGHDGNILQDGLFSPSTETKNRKTKELTQIKGKSTSAAAFGLPDAYSLSDRRFSVDPARTGAKTGATDLPGLFSDFLVFDEQQQRSRK